MLFRVLGPLEIDGAGGPESVGGPVPRRLLTALLTSPGQVVPVDSLLAAAWGDQPPRSAERTVQSHLTRLREALTSIDDALRVERRDGGYRLVVDPDAVDAVRFERMSTRARDLAAPEAVAALRGALALWRPPAPYADLQDTAYPAAEAARLTEMRGAATDSLCTALLESGDLVGAAVESESSLRLDPYRERLWEVLVVALYRQGRQGDALAAYRRARRELDEGLGIEPGPRLREIEAQVLAQDPALLGGPVLQRRPCPYKGLARYDVSDADLYVGRERLVEELLSRLVDSGLLVVVGPSGAGKSSLVRAGLVSALAAGGLPGSAQWSVDVVVPGTDPMHVLGAAVSGRPDVLVVDQAEEALLADDGTWVVQFGDAVLSAVAAGTRVVLALRADFYGRLAGHPALARSAGPATVLVAPPDDDELRRIITEPASRVGLRVEPALADLVVAEVRGRPGSLPVLSTALVRAWEQRTGDTLTVAAYRAGGGVDGAVQRVGEEAWAVLDDDAQRAACRRILLRLAVEEDGAWVRRRARRSEIVPPGDAPAEATLGVLTGRRLVVAGADDVEIAHESLLTGWPRLRRWLDDGRDHAEVRQRLAVSSAAWDSAGRDVTELYRGTRLQSALDTAAASPDDLTSVERDFLKESSAAADRELGEQRDRADREARGRRRTRAVALGLAMALVIAAAAGGVAVHQRQQAETQTAAAQRAADTADAETLGARARTGGAYDTALLLAAQAVRLDPSPQTESDLLATLLRGDDVIATLRSSEHVEALAFTPDGRSVLTLGTFGNLTEWPATGGEPTLHAGSVGGNLTRAMAFAADGTPIVGLDGGPVLWDVSGRRPLDVAPAGAAAGRWALMADGRTVAAAHLGPQFHYDRTLVIWTPRVGTGTEPARSVTLPAIPAPEHENVQACGADVCVLLGTKDGYLAQPALARVRLSDGFVRPLLPLPADMTMQIVTSPDGGYLAFARRDGIVRLLDLHDGVTRELPGTVGSSRPLAFSPDGSMLAASDGTAVVVWDLRTGGVPMRADVSSGALEHAAWSPDGATLATSSTDGSVVLWDVGGRRRFASVVTTALTPGASAVTTIWPVTGHVVVGYAGGAGRAGLEFVDTTTGVVQQAAQSPHTGASEVPTARSGPSGPFLVTADDTGVTAVWDPATQRLLGTVDVGLLPRVTGQPPQGTRRYSADTWVSPDGRFAATIRSDDGPVVIDLSSRRVLRQLPALPDTARTMGASVLGWSADGGDLFIAQTYPEGQAATVLDVGATSGVVRWSVPIDGTLVNEAAPSPDGRFVAVVEANGVLRVLDPRDGHDLATPMQAADGDAVNVSISPDSRHLVVSSAPAQVAVFDTSSFRTAAVSLPLDASAADARARFAPDGSLLVASDNVLRRVTVDPEAWLTRACREAGRTLTVDEWAQYLPDRPYTPACT